MTYQQPDLPRLADELEGEQWEALQAQQPSWQPLPADPFTRLGVANALVVAEAIARLTLTDEEITRRAAELHGIVQDEAVPARMTTTWSLADADGHDIEAGWTVQVTTAAGLQSLWAVRDTVVVPNGSSASGAGEVVLVAVSAVGEDGNGVTGTVDPVQPAPTWVSSITVVTPGEDGVNEESDGDYLDRATRELTARSGLIMKADQLAALALSVPGVGRAFARRTYNPVGPDDAAAGHMTVAVANDDGDDCTTQAKEEVEALPAADGVTLHAVDFDRHTVGVTASGTAHDGWDPATVKAACEEALAGWLSPLAWAALADGGLQSMFAKDTVRMDEAAAVIYSATPGLKQLAFSSIEIKVDAGASAHADGALSGDFPLTEPGAITVTIS